MVNRSLRLTVNGYEKAAKKNKSNYSHPSEKISRPPGQQAIRTGPGAATESTEKGMENEVIGG